MTATPKKSSRIPTAAEVLKQQNQDTKKTLPAKAPRALVADNDNPWIAIGAEIDKFLGAPLLKFSKQGEFAVGDSEVIADGTRCIARADEVTLGWQKWEDGKPVEKRTGRVADGFVPPSRSELGDTDEQKWEVGDDGRARDPWQFQMTMPLTRLDAGGETYLFTASSKGGLRCVGALTRAYGRRVRDEKVPGLPVVELQSDSYKHRTYGKIFFPVMHIVGWSGADGKPLSVAEDLNDAVGF